MVNLGITIPAASLVLAALALLSCSAMAVTKPNAKTNPAVKLSPTKIQVLSQEIVLLNDPKHEGQFLPYNKEYVAGDTILVRGPHGLDGFDAMVVQLDANLPECLVYAQKGAVQFAVPFGRGGGQERRVYPPEAFEGANHIIKARPATLKELNTYRNLALNPYDVRGDTTFYPHASSNSECRNEPDFCARNAIDGFKQNTGHGAWPFQSWGPDQRKDLWLNIEFGRPVEIDKLILYIRADFPHDKYWNKAAIDFSDGSHESIDIQKTADAQEFKFKKRVVTWIHIAGLVQEEPLGWCGFTEVEVWGRDLVKAKGVK